MGCGGSSGSGTGATGTGATGSPAATSATTASGKTTSGGGTTTNSTTAATTAATTSTTVTTGGGGSGGTSGAGGGGGSGPAVQCNPVTNMGCTGGAACDITQDNQGQVNGFVCYAPPNTAVACATCNDASQTGPFCAGGATCIPIDQQQTITECAQYCCTDGDCGPGGTCDTTDMLFAPVATGLGVCLATASAGTGGSGGSTGAGGDPTTALACSPPATAPSNGSCVTVGQ